MARQPTTIYCMQDGQDFMIYLTPACDKLHNSWRYPHRVGMSLPLAQKAREAFEAQIRLAGYQAVWPNPFGSESNG